MLLQKTISSITEQDPAWRDRAVQRIETLTMPHWALGRILDLAVDLAGMTRTLELPVARKRIVLMAGDHGIVAEGVSPQPSDVTIQMVKNFVAGGGGINVLAGVSGADITLADIGVKGDLSDLVREGKVLDCKIAPGTRNFAKEPAMSREQAVRAVEYGIEVANHLADVTDVFATGEMGIGNTSPSSAIVTVLSGETDPSAYVDRGAGLPSERVRHKIQVLRDAIRFHQPDPNDPIDVLSKIGGFEIAGIAGVILGAAAQRKPVLVDGFISTAGALIAKSLSPKSADYMIAAHSSMEKGHLRMRELLGKQPLLDLNLRLGEGTGAALAMPLLDAAAAVLTRMATFESAGVTEKGIRS